MVEYSRKTFHWTFREAYSLSRIESPLRYFDYSVMTAFADLLNYRLVYFGGSRTRANDSRYADGVEHSV